MNTAHELEEVGLTLAGWFPYVQFRPTAHLPSSPLLIVSHHPSLTLGGLLSISTRQTISEPIDGGLGALGMSLLGHDTILVSECRAGYDTSV